MAEPKENESFFRKVVRFVANPATDWTELNSRQFEARELEVEQSELKAMIERKRRNDFVRKREFDVLRKVRREGLSPEQLAALGGSSRLDDSEVRAAEAGNARPDGVKAKIDEIEQQMVGDSAYANSRRTSGFFNATTLPMPMGNAGAGSTSAEPAGRLVEDSEMLPALPPLSDGDDAPTAAPASAPAVMAPGLSPLSALPELTEPLTMERSPSGEAMEVNEVVHDAELDEAVISFANADFEQCEQSLTRLIETGGERHLHAETWLVLFDLFRAIGQQARFESLALDYARQFGWSAPQWFSLPQQVADAVAQQRPKRTSSVSTPSSGEVGWLAPAHLDIEAVARLRSQTLQMPLPWVFDWGALRQIDAEAATQLSVLCRVWSGQALEMRWLAGEKLFEVLHDAAPTGVRDADPSFWLARLDALRLANRADQFDEAAIDYCVTYEVSPPSWEPTRCKVHMAGSDLSTRPPPLSMISDVSTSFMESAMPEFGVIEQASVELSGQLIGDVHPTLGRLDEELGDAKRVVVSCTRLIRVDFLAAGDLLNWVLTKRKEERTVHFVDAHRLVASFFGAMGITEHAQVQIRNL